MVDAKYRPWRPVKVRPDNDPPRNNLEIRKCDAIAIHAVASGTANEGQQKAAFAAILFICGTDDQDWMPEEHGGARDTDFAAGKRHVGLQLRKLGTFSISVLTGDPDDGSDHDRRAGKPRDDRNARRAKR